MAPPWNCQVIESHFIEAIVDTTKIVVEIKKSIIVFIFRCSKQLYMLCYVSHQHKIQVQTTLQLKFGGSLV